MTSAEIKGKYSNYFKVIKQKTAYQTNPILNDELVSDFELKR